MTAISVAVRSAPGKYKFLGTAALTNAYAEQQGEDGKAVLSILPSDGIVELVDEAPGPCRGMIYLEDLDKLYSVHPSSVYLIENDSGTFTARRIGTIPGIDPVQLSRNQKADVEIVVRSNSGVQIIASDSVSYVLDNDLPDDVETACVAKGYAIYGEENGKFTLSGLNTAKVIDALDFATFEQRSDKLIRVFEHAGELLGLKSRSMEFWRSVADEDFPFAPIGFKSRGLLAAHAVVEADNTIMFPGDDFNIHRLNNYDPQVISTHEVARLIREDASPENIIGFGWEADGHAFVNFTGANWSRCYDSATKLWHTRESYGLNHWRARYSATAWGKRIIGDAISGKLGYLSSDTFTEYGGTMIWGVDFPPMHVFPNGGIVDAVHFDVATGYGTLSGQGSNPKIMLQVSRDGGNTFGGYRELELGVRGKYATRVTARRLGRFGPKGAVFRLRISDPVVRSIALADVNVRPLKNASLAA